MGKSKRRIVGALAVALGALAGAPALAQDAVGADGEWQYRTSCAGCHGLQGEGIYPFGVPLKGNAMVQNVPAAVLVEVIQKGRKYGDASYPAYSGMPGFANIRGEAATSLADYLKGGLQE